MVLASSDVATSRINIFSKPKREITIKIIIIASAFEYTPNPETPSNCPSATSTKNNAMTATPLRMSTIKDRRQTDW